MMIAYIWPSSSLSVVVRALAAVCVLSSNICWSQLMRNDCASRITSTLTYNEMGTTVLRTMAYEKKMSKAIMVEPAAADSVGMSGSHGKYGLKY